MTGTNTGRFRTTGARAAAGAAAGALAVLLAAGCSTAQDAEESPSEANASDGTYPVTVETAFGEVTVEQTPERVVALGFAPAEAALSLGVEPVSVAEDPDALEQSVPWMAEEIADTADPGLLGADGEPNLEAIAAAEPDLILAQTYQVADQTAFDNLNAIAPTVLPATDALNVDWDERLLKTAEALGRPTEAEELISQIRAEFTEIGATVPDIEERTYQWVRADADGYGFGNGSLFELFGLRPAENQDNTQGSDPLSREHTADLDADLLAVWAPSQEERQQLDDDPLFQNLPAVEAGTVYYADLAFANAINSAGPMSLRWIAEELRPVVEELG
ncbi:ABC transporter substrate-binding protein [Nocardiopsis ganjiahuensis]|uniref:ABC transporter substrate-binding protein n=1 Tax=Nocardiopsis ganjiahuensis TaxID=239984 RepID=UPI00034C367E|nr:iron-siderophore ABC transporter substrate-binding protein [Nocardiopsis ganjiahuensis]